MRLPLPVRRALSGLVGRVPVRIRSGPNEGVRWSLSAAGRHRSGSFERPRVEAILALIRPGDCVWDIGAHHGYVSLAVSRAVGPDGHVLSFEPSAYNYAYLSRHVRWNGRDNVTPLKLGVAAAPGRAKFGGTGSSQTFRIGGGTEEVELTPLESLMDGNHRRPDLVKIDVEGAEGSILDTGARQLPPTSMAVVSVHSLENYRRCVSALRSAGFTVYLSDGVRDLRGRGDWGDDDPDLVAVGAERGDVWDLVLGLGGFSELDE